MIGLENRTISTPRLTLRLAEPRDEAALFSYLTDETVTRPAGFLPITTQEEFDTFFDQLTEYHTGIAICLGDTCIGYARVNRERLEQPEYADKYVVGLGFVIGKPYQGLGYGTEMLTALTAYLKERFDYCVCDHFMENDASRRVIEKAGYQFLEDYEWEFPHLGNESKQLRSYIY